MKKNFLIILILILIIGFFFRFSGIYPGYPSHPDEAAYGSALVMVLNNNLDPGRYDYGGAVAHIHYLFFKFVFIPFGWITFFLQNLGKVVDGILRLPLSKVDYDRIFQLTILGPQQINTMYWGRYITAAFGLGIVFITYFLAKKLFGQKVALISSFLVAVNYRQVLNSHIGLQDIYNGFFLMLIVYFSYNLIEKPSRKNYFLVGLVNAIFFSIKFQIFGFVVLFVSHILATLDKSEGIFVNLRKIFFSKRLFLSGIVSIFFIALINPYHLINFELFVQIQRSIFAKYGGGVNILNVYPISYLYHIGIGETISILVVLGFIVALIKYFKKSLLINIVIFQSLLTFLYLTRGGFYTRNFVTITPFLLIYAALFINDVFNFVFKSVRFKWIYFLSITFFVLIISWGNISNSYIVAKFYSKPWNQNILSDWVEKNIPPLSIVSAHPNTPLPVKDVVRLTYEPDDAFSIDEFKESGAQYAISNSAWTTNGFYWWMGGDPVIFAKHYWNKPTDIMEYSYPALTLLELQQFMVYSVENPWQAPDVNFLVAKIPNYSVSRKSEIVTYNFDKDTEGWTKKGKFWVQNDNLDWKPGALLVKEEPASIPSLRWESSALNVTNWGGFEIDFRMKTESFSKKNLRTGYVFANFYKSLDDANASKNRVGLRISSRDSVFHEWVLRSLIGQIPEEAKYMTIGFYNYNPNQSETELSSLKVYKANVTVDFSGVKITNFHVNENNLFPNSHGNL